MTPAFTVVIATFGRGALVEATLESVARQSVRDIEVLVVSDGPAAPGLADTVARFDDRFRLVETAKRCGSQYLPNNTGWSLARGTFIAYLGHDDIWLPGHLAALRDAFDRHPTASFAASGCIYFGPPGAGPGHAWVTGMFDPDDPTDPDARLSVARTNFFPPSSVAHRRNLPPTLRWPNAHRLRRPVDSAFMLTAAQRGFEFTSTRTITVLKFNSAYRYLSYLSPDDDEQRAALDLAADPERVATMLDTAVADARASGKFMTTRHPRIDGARRGQAVRDHAVVRGIDTPRVRRLSGSVTIPVGDDLRALDWHTLERNDDHAWRWSGPNSRPRLLVPFTHDGPVRIELHLDAIAADDVRDSLTALVDRRPVPLTVRREGGTNRYVLELESVLRSDVPSVIELRMHRTVPARDVDPDADDQRLLGVCLTSMRLSPASH